MMPRKRKGGSRGSSPEKGSESDTFQYGNQFDSSSSPWAIMSQPVVTQTDETVRDKMFQKLQEIFQGKIEDQVIYMVLAECNWKADDAMEKLFLLVPESDGEREDHLQSGGFLGSKMMLHPTDRIQSVPQSMPSNKLRSRLPSQSSAVLPMDGHNLTMLSPKTPSEGFSDSFPGLFVNMPNNNSASAHTSVQSAMQALDSYANSSGDMPQFDNKGLDRRHDMLGGYYGLQQQVSVGSNNSDQNLSMDHQMGESDNHGLSRQVSQHSSHGAFMDEHDYSRHKDGKSLLSNNSTVGQSINKVDRFGNAPPIVLPLGHLFQPRGSIGSTSSASPSPSPTTPVMANLPAQPNPLPFPPSHPKASINNSNSTKPNSSNICDVSNAQKQLQRQHQQTMVRTRGHRKKTLSLNPEEREALENLIEDVIIGGVGQGIINSDGSTSDTEDEFADRLDDSSGSDTEKGDKSSGTMSKVYPAQLKVAVKHMKNLPPRFLRRLQNAQKQIDAAAALDMEAEKIAREEHERIELETIMCMAKDRERGRSKEDQLKETKKKIRHLLENLDQYIDEGLVLDNVEEQLEVEPESIADNSMSGTAGLSVRLPSTHGSRQSLQNISPLQGEISVHSPGSVQSPNSPHNQNTQSNTLLGQFTPSTTLGSSGLQVGQRGTPSPNMSSGQRQPYVLNTSAVNCHDLEKELLGGINAMDVFKDGQFEQTPHSFASKSSDIFRHVPPLSDMSYPPLSDMSYPPPPVGYSQHSAAMTQAMLLDMKHATQLSADAPEFVPMRGFGGFTPPQHITPPPAQMASEGSSIPTPQMPVAKSVSPFLSSDRMSPHMPQQQVSRHSPHGLPFAGPHSSISHILTDPAAVSISSSLAGAAVISQASIGKTPNRSSSPAFLTPKVPPPVVPPPTSLAAQHGGLPPHPPIGVLPVQHYTLPPPPFPPPPTYPPGALPPYRGPYLPQYHHPRGAWAGKKPPLGVESPFHPGIPPHIQHPLMGSPLTSNKLSPQLAHRSKGYMYTGQVRPGVVPGPGGPRGPHPQGTVVYNACQAVSGDVGKLRVQHLISEGKKIMVILRGCPGSGKSTIAKAIQMNGVILCTDDFFYKDGKYEYDFGKLPDAHEWNQKNAKAAVDEDKSPIIVDNTNTQSWEMKVYVSLALKHDYHIEIMEPDTPWRFNAKELSRRNSHGVSQETIQRMLDRYERVVTLHSIMGVSDNKKHELMDQQQTPSTEVKKTRKRKKKKRKRNRKRDKGGNAAAKSASGDGDTGDDGASKNTSDDSSDEDNTEERPQVIQEGGGDNPVERNADADEKVVEKDGLNTDDQKTLHIEYEENSKDVKPSEELDADTEVGDSANSNINSNGKNKQLQEESRPCDESKSKDADTEPSLNGTDHSSLNSSSQSCSEEREASPHSMPVEGENRERKNSENDPSDEIPFIDDGDNEGGERAPYKAVDLIKGNQTIKLYMSSEPVLDEHSLDDLKQDMAKSETRMGQMDEKQLQHKIEMVRRALSIEGRGAEIEDNLSSDNELDVETEVKQIIEENILKSIVRRQMVHFMKMCPEKFVTLNSRQEARRKRSKESTPTERTLDEEAEIRKMAMMMDIQKALESIDLSAEGDIDLDREFQDFDVVEEMMDYDEDQVNKEQLENPPDKEKEKQYWAQVAAPDSSYQVLATPPTKAQAEPELGQSSLEDPLVVVSQQGSWGIEEVSGQTGASPQSPSGTPGYLDKPKEKRERRGKRQRKAISDSPPASAEFWTSESTLQKEDTPGQKADESIPPKQVDIAAENKGEDDYAHDTTSKVESHEHLPADVREKLMSHDWVLCPLNAVGSDSSMANIVTLEDLGVACRDAETYTDPAHFSFVHRINQCADDAYEAEVISFAASNGNRDRILIAHPHELVTCDLATEESSSSATSSPSRPQIVKLDRSCWTGDDEHVFETVTETASVDFLQTCFPQVGLSDLQGILDQCQGNTEWAVNLLLDSGYEYNVGQGDGENPGAGMIETNNNVPDAPLPAADNNVLEESLGAVAADVETASTSHLALDSIGSHSALDSISSTKGTPCPLSPNSLVIMCHESLKSKDIGLSEEDVAEKFAEHSLLRLQKQKQAATSGSVLKPNNSPCSSKKSKLLPPKTDKIEDTQDNAATARVTPSAPALPESLPENVYCNHDEDDPITLHLSPHVAKQLISKFGPVGFHMSPDSLSSSDLFVRLPSSVSHEIHKHWARSLRSKFNSEEAQIYSMIHEDEALARSLQEAEDASMAQAAGQEMRDSSNCPPDEETPNLREIMEEEMVMEVSKQSYKEAQEMLREQEQALSTKIKWQQLAEMFPRIDSNMLKELFQANGYNLGATISTIQATLGEVPNVCADIRGPQSMQEYNDVLEKVIGESLKDQWLGVDSAGSGEESANEESYQALEDPAYHDFRAEASLHYQLRHEAFQKAQEAHAQGRRGVAAFYSQQGHVHTEKLRQANNRAAQMIVQHKNTNLSQNNMLDLHGLHVPEALQALDQIIAQREIELSERPDMRKRHLLVVTGRGSHSRGGAAKIRPAVMGHLRKNNYSFSEPSPSMLKVHLRHRDRK